MSHGHPTGSNPVLNRWAIVCILLLFVMVTLFYWQQAIAANASTSGAMKLSLSLAIVASFIAGIIALLKRDTMKLAGTVLITLVVFANIIYLVPVLLA